MYNVYNCTYNNMYNIVIKNNYFIILIILRVFMSYSEKIILSLN